jgi:uncharacterized membrane protein
MARALTIATWLLFAATIYLILAGPLGQWVHLPMLGDIGFTLVFVLFALAHCIAYEGAKRTAVFFAVSAVVSLLMEKFGVRTSLIYGAYHFGSGVGDEVS